MDVHLPGERDRWSYEDGQWYYHAGKQRQFRYRAEERSCPHCGRIFMAPRGCGTQKFCSRYCSGNGVKRVGRPGKRPGPLSHCWRGGRTITKAGYVMIWAPDHPTCQHKTKKYVLEHRLVMEEMLGRLMLPSETVHHKDGNRQNNDPANLELRQGAHGPGSTEKHCPTCTCFACE